MKRLFFTIALVLMMSLTAVFAETIKAGISIESVPKAFYGCWQVDADLQTSNNYSTFKPKSRDLWNLSRMGDVIKLENPFTKAHAEIEIKHTEDNVIVFYKESTFDNKLLKDTVTIRLNGDTFGGYNDIVLETLSLRDGHVIKRDVAKYLIKGKRLGGTSVLGK